MNECPLDTPFVRAQDDKILRRDVQAANVVIDHRSGVQVVDRDVEEALDLGGMQVQGESAVGAGPGNKVGDQLGGDRHPAHVLAVLAGVAIIGQDCGEPGSAGSLEAVQHDEQLHQVLVDRRAGRLHYEHVPAADILLDPHRDFTVGKVIENDSAQGVSQAIGNSLRQGAVGAATKDFEFVVVAYHG